MGNSNRFRKTILSQQDLLYATLDKYLFEGMNVALLDFPNHNNVGDNAIWLGEKEALKKIGVNVVYQCDVYSFSEKALRRKLDSGAVVLMHGGGNLGSVWPEHQRFREMIIRLLPDMKIIQLPQSVHFDVDHDRFRFGEVAKAHEDYHVLVRDKASFHLLREIDLNVELCPDMAFALGAMKPQGKHVVDIVWLARTDHESIDSDCDILKYEIEKVDWLYGEPGRAFSKLIMRFTVRIRRIVQKAYQRFSILRDYFGGINAMFFDALAWSRLNRGIRMLSRGKAVITDRLHGHILATLIGKPQILFDNHYRKIGNYVDCFTKSQEAIFYVADGNGRLNVKESISKAVEIHEMGKSNE